MSSHTMAKNQGPRDKDGVQQTILHSKKSPTRSPRRKLDEIPRINRPQRMWMDEAIHAKQSASSEKKANHPLIDTAGNVHYNAENKAEIFATTMEKQFSTQLKTINTISKNK